MYIPNMLSFRKCLAGSTVVLALVGCGGSGSGSHSAQQYVYVAAGGNVSQFRIGAGGGLTPLSPATVTAANAYAITGTKDGKFVYAADYSTGLVSQYSVGDDGALTPLSPATVNPGGTLYNLAASPDSKHLYVVAQGGAIDQYSIGTDGTLTPLSPASVPMASDGDGITVSPDGKFVYATSYGSGKVSVFSIGVSGALTAVTTYDLDSPDSPRLSPDGENLYVACSTDGVAQFSVASDGTLTALSPATVAGSGAGNDAIAITPNGHFLYNGIYNGGTADSPVDQYAINGDGTITALSPKTIAAGNAPRRAWTDSSGRYLYVANENDGNVSQFSIDSNGHLTAMATPTVSSSGANDLTVLTR